MTSAFRARSFSALQRAENSSTKRPSVNLTLTVVCFSALQRAENSSTRVGAQHQRAPPGFQCSSASRKFLNAASVQFGCVVKRVSVLFSEPKIPQPKPIHYPAQLRDGVSVLFSEPKIPQPPAARAPPATPRCFSALQRAENSSTW